MVSKPMKVEQNQSNVVIEKAQEAPNDKHDEKLNKTNSKNLTTDSKKMKSMKIDNVNPGCTCTIL